jgi:hypothetical protein
MLEFNNDAVMEVGDEATTSVNSPEPIHSHTNFPEAFRHRAAEDEVSLFGRVAV